MTGTHADWRWIQPRPLVASLPPTALLDYLQPGATILEVGCGGGSVCRYLLEHGFKVTGIDLNLEAVAAAVAATRNQRDRARFAVTDYLATRGSGRFDAVVLIRVLTCIPNSDDRQRAWTVAADHLRPGGLIYVRDFLVTDTLHYRQRYAEGLRLGLGAGNFIVPDVNGRPMFIAHHHSDDELDALRATYKPLRWAVDMGTSMNGNPCRTCECIGRRDNPY